MTNQYLQDRAHMLERLIEGNVEDAQYVPITENGSEYFYDYASGTQVLTTDFSGNFSAEPLVNNPEVRTNTINYIFGGTDGDSFKGGNLADRLYGGAGEDVIDGLGGSDYIEGNEGRDILNGNGGEDILRGGSERDLLRGGQDNDELYGGSGNDDLLGEAGDDRLEGGDDADRLEGGAGVDTYIAGDGDTIMDSDGFGLVYYNDHYLFGGIRSDSDPAGQYRGYNGNVTYTLSGTTLTVSELGQATSMTIENFDKDNVTLCHKGVLNISGAGFLLGQTFIDWRKYLALYVVMVALSLKVSS